MSNITGTIRGRATVQEAQSPTIYNVPVALANTEYSQALNAGTKSFQIRVRGVAALKLAFSSGDSGTLYTTIPAGTTQSFDGLNFDGTLYFQSTKAAQVVEIIEWL